MKPGDESAKHFGVYLNDHLAGSVGALQLVEHLAKNHAGTPLEKFFADLHIEISSDQEVLSDLMRTWKIGESAVRQAGAWVAEKLGRVKLGLTESQVQGLGFVQALEALEMGITGKRMLWRALAAAAETNAELRGPDYGDLEQRAVEQFDRVDGERLKAAHEAFGK